VVLCYTGCSHGVSAVLRERPMPTLFSGTQNRLLTDDEGPAIPIGRFVPGLDRSSGGHLSHGCCVSGADVPELARDAKHRRPGLLADY
jgi:hypothetical protein